MAAGLFKSNFSRLIQEAAAIDENKSQVESKQATLEVEAEMNGEIYVFGMIFVVLVILGFEAVYIKLLQSYVLKYLIVYIF